MVAEPGDLEEAGEVGRCRNARAEHSEDAGSELGRGLVRRSRELDLAERLLHARVGALDGRPRVSLGLQVCERPPEVGADPRRRIGNYRPTFAPRAPTTD